MKESFLHFIWKYKLFNFQHLQTTHNESIGIEKFGIHNHDEGADFLHAEILLEGLRFNGSIEIHLKSSDWNLHQHTHNPHYQNLILHVVYENDVEIPELNTRKVPTLVLKPYISEEIIQKYLHLEESKAFIPCESLIQGETNALKDFSFTTFYEKLNLEKLEANYDKILDLLEQNNGDWEAVLFQRLAYTFGLKVNAEPFLQLAKNIPFSTLKKVQQKEFSLMALFFGKAGLLKDPQDDFHASLQQEYQFLQHKHKFSDEVTPVKFLRLRPANFPTLKLAQLAHLYAQYQNLFSYCMGLKKISQWHQLFNAVQAHSYFDNHYTFGKTSETLSPKKLSQNGIDLLLINAILPVKFAYEKHLKLNTTDTLALLEDIKPEKNSIVNAYQQLQFPIKNSFDTQALLFLHKNYCSQKKCLNCPIGFQELKK